MSTYPTPTSAVRSKTSAGFSDVSIGTNGVYRFMGCSIISVSMTLGFNGTANSLSITMVEDIDSGDIFLEPIIPSIWAFSLPKGGVGVPVFYPSGTSMDPNAFNPSNTPFYFTGICTHFQGNKRDIGGKTITVTLVDPREVLTGVQCLLNSFALSQNIGTGGNRYIDVNNTIDVFGYYDYGMTSDANKYGMQWNKIKTVLEAVRVTINDMSFEFYFTNDTFNEVPDWYRLDDTIIDIIGLTQKVATDSGSDFVTIARKTSATDCVVEFRGIKRINDDPIYQVELDTFVNDRTDIVESYRLGKEYRNEPTSSIVIGGMRNGNYVAYPSTYDPDMHLNAIHTLEDYNQFPVDLKVRLFGGTSKVHNDTNASGAPIFKDQTYDVDSGAIFPFWGFTPDDSAYPLIEPFLSLDHLVFDRNTQLLGHLRSKIPACKIEVANYTVRNVPHTTMFLDGDEAPDSRPFARLAKNNSASTNNPSKVDYIFTNDSVLPSGYLRGLPLNTEVLRASLAGQEAFYAIYALYYPEIASSGYFFGPPFKALRKMVENAGASGSKFNIEDYPQFAIGNGSLAFEETLGTITPAGPSGTYTTQQWEAVANKALQVNVIEKFHSIIYEHVRQYALDNMGKKFLVALPRSEIMNRIWANLPVPTSTIRPEIEYTVDQRGYWETVPNELDGVVNGTSVFTGSEEDQIRRRFMADDGRFYAMVGIDWHPSGNVNFNSNGINKAMFQDFPTSEFRPNKIASGNPSFVLVSCNVNQLSKRPDLAFVELPAAIQFDPTDRISIEHFNDKVVTDDGTLDDEDLATKAGIVKYLWYLYHYNDDFYNLVTTVALSHGMSNVDYASKVILRWATYLMTMLNNPFKRSMSTEYVMDLKGVVIPLTSTWVFLWTLVCHL
jgi:hypothetical protein